MKIQLALFLTLVMLAIGAPTPPTAFLGSTADGRVKRSVTESSTLVETTQDDRLAKRSAVTEKTLLGSTMRAKRSVTESSKLIETTEDDRRAKRSAATEKTLLATADEVRDKRSVVTEKTLLATTGKF